MMKNCKKKQTDKQRGADLNLTPQIVTLMKFLNRCAAHSQQFTTTTK